MNYYQVKPSNLNYDELRHEQVPQDATLREDSDEEWELSSRALGAFEGLKGYTKENYHDMCKADVKAIQVERVYFCVCKCKCKCKCV
jgi:hypothetical protein